MSAQTSILLAISSTVALITFLVLLKKHLLSVPLAVLASVSLGALIQAFGFPWHFAPLLTLGAIGTSKFMQGELKSTFLRIWSSQIASVDILISVCGVGVAVYSMVLYINNSNLFLLDGSLSLSPLLLILGAIVNGTVEETVWRWASLTALIRGASAGVSIVISSIMFGWSHYSYGIPSGLAGIIMAGSFGAFQSVLYLRTGSIVLIAGIHVSVNFAILLYLTR